MLMSSTNYKYSSLRFRSGRLQPVHLPLAPGVYRYGLSLNIPAVRASDLGQGVYRQTDEPVQVLRFRIIRQPDVGTGRHIGDERFPNRHETTEGAAEEGQGCVQALLRTSVNGTYSQRARHLPPPRMGRNYTKKFTYSN